MICQVLDEATILEGTFTMFFDMASGGTQKLDTDRIFIEADKDTAVEVFVEVFDIYPFNITCDCCGEDYSVDAGRLNPEAHEGDYVIGARAVAKCQQDINKLTNNLGE